MHNSHLFSDIGYYYPDSDIEAGAAQLLLARREHDRNLTSYMERANRAIAALSPENLGNRNVYARRLIALSLADHARRRA